MTANDKITWTNERRKLSDLIPWDINPATISKDAAKRLEESLDEFGQVETIAISPSNEIYDGHQRQVVWGASSKFGMGYEVDVRVSSRPLTERERKKLVIYLRKGAVGEFDFDVLANNFELSDLLEWGFSENELGIGDNPYTGKISLPCYEPNENKPLVNELYSNDKTQKLIEEINNSNFLSESEKAFLILAAYRHVVFSFKKIADYYSNSSKEIQDLMEKSGLVIIDYKKAIENGFFEFTDSITELYIEDYER